VIIIALIGGFFYYQNVAKEEKAVDGTFVEKILDLGVNQTVMGGWKNYALRW
jgi:hypothetical protein